MTATQAGQSTRSARRSGATGIAARPGRGIMQRTARRFVLAGLSMLVAFGAAPAGAELASWDQARVTAIAQQLVAAADAWEQAVREQPGGEIGSGDAESEFGLGMKARVLREQSQALAGQLAKGEGHDETRNSYRDMAELIDDTEELAQRSELEAPTMDAWAKLVDAQRQIAPYYDHKALEESDGGKE